MTCVACGHTMISKLGEIDLRVYGELFIVRHVMFEECPNCGERVIAPEVSEKIYRDITTGRYRWERITLPVVEAT